MQTLAHRARDFLDTHRDERITLGRLAAALGTSPFHLQRAFKRALGLSPLDYQREQRLAEAKRLLARGTPVTDAVFGAGYGSASRFYESEAGRLGMSARDYRARGRGQRIAYTVFRSRLGQVLAARSARGLCALKLGDRSEPLLRELRAEFSEAELVREGAGLAAVRRAVHAYLAGDGTLARLPLDLRGTVFQRRVWDALRRIPLGETQSYAGLARAIGQPRAVRAVGGACAANPVALVVPCHRAIRADGGLGGYAWGLARKSALLRLETKTMNAGARRPTRK